MRGGEPPFPSQPTMLCCSWFSRTRLCWRDCRPGPYLQQGMSMNQSIKIYTTAQCTICLSFNQNLHNCTIRLSFNQNLHNCTIRISISQSKSTQLHKMAINQSIKIYTTDCTLSLSINQNLQNWLHFTPIYQ